MKYNWNWGIFFELEPGSSGTYLHYLLVGLGWTLATALAAWAIALALGALVGTLRTTPGKWLARLCTAYVELFRNIPLLVQMFLWFFVLPELLPKAAGDWMKQLPPPWPPTCRPCCASRSTPRCASPSRCARASSRCRAASAWPARRWG